MTVTTPLPFDIRWLAFLLLYPNLARCMLRWGLQPHAGGAATVAEEIPERQRGLCAHIARCPHFVAPMHPVSIRCGHRPPGRGHEPLRRIVRQGGIRHHAEPGLGPSRTFPSCPPRSHRNCASGPSTTARWEECSCATSYAARASRLTTTRCAHACSYLVPVWIW